MATVLVLGYIYFSRPTALVAEVTSGRAVKAVPGSVIVQAEFEMELKSEVGGRVVKSNLDPGKTVAAGEVLCQLDTGDLELEIEKITNEYETAKKRIAVGSSIALELQNAQDDLKNYEQLYRSGNFPESELVKKRRGVKQIEQSYALEKVNNAQLLEGFENTLRVKQRQLEKMTIVAPFDGVVSMVYARPGDLIGGNSSIATLISTSRTVEAKISEENFADLKVGQKASVRFLPYGAWLYDATLVKILPTADPETQRYIVHLEVKIEPEKLVPGITGEVTIVVGERDAKAKIPRRALFGNYVYVVEDGTVHLRDVETGFVSLTTVEILKGLTAGQQVIVDQLDRFREGDRVRPDLVERVEKK
ncbi:MAG: efflux RND transporter periplasmic adaptor subunit [Cephaloticoccus sp.]|nr:efflux RND transporter periplasmic adaptor subunit [Cephaloticoccus sp.]MCF7760766.1 efflux RND transporter periplasmic adaptor subunit [Cephaloticoccus sp.]